MQHNVSASKDMKNMTENKIKECSSTLSFPVDLLIGVYCTSHKPML